MAVDRKADHVGNHGGAYIDNDGQRKQFTYVDHDIKTKIGVTKAMKEEELKSLQETIKTYAQEQIDEILAMPAVSFLMTHNEFAEDYVIRDPEKGIIWNETLVRDALTINSDMRYTVHLAVWRATVKESNWFDPIRDDHEAMLKGDWKTLM